MHRQWVRLSAVIIVLVAMAISGYRLVSLEQQRAMARDHAAAYRALVSTVTLALADIRGAQHAYVAAGQDATPWMTRVSGGLDQIAGSLTDLEHLALNESATEAIGDAREALRRLRRVDTIAREHTEDGQQLMASDLVFTDGHDLTRRAAGHLELARSIEVDAAAADDQRLRRGQVWTASLGGILASVVALGLFWLGTTAPPAKRTAGASSPASRDGATAMTGSAMDPLGDLALEGDDGDKPDDADDLPGLPDMVHPPLERSGEVAAMVVPDLTLAAQVCTDLGRLNDQSELGGVLAQAGELLNASGLVVWVRDDTGSSLRPAAAHGYSSAVLAQLGRVPTDGHNVTATAYRSGQAQVFAGNADTPGGVAVPLISARTDDDSTSAIPGAPGCVGVLSAEVAHGWETSEAVLATTAIVAAQLATFVTPDPPADETASEDTTDEDGVTAAAVESDEAPAAADVTADPETSADAETADTSDDANVQASGADGEDAGDTADGDTTDGEAAEPAASRTPPPH